MDAAVIQPFWSYEADSCVYASGDWTEYQSIGLAIPSGSVSNLEALDVGPNTVVVELSDAY